MLLIFFLLYVYVFRLLEILNIFLIFDFFQKVVFEIFLVINECFVCLLFIFVLSIIFLFFLVLILKLLNSFLYFNKDLNRDLLMSLVFVMILLIVMIELLVFMLFYVLKDQRCRLVGGYDCIVYVIFLDLKFLDIVKCRCYFY